MSRAPAALAALLVFAPATADGPVPTVPRPPRTKPEAGPPVGHPAVQLWGCRLAGYAHDEAGHVYLRLECAGGIKVLVPQPDKERV